MSGEDLSKLKIDKAEKHFRPRSRKKMLFFLLGLPLVAILSFLYLTGYLEPPTAVEVTTVSQIFPSQTLAELNASGYVAAQRKAAVASKITGRLVQLLVEEGSRVKEGQIIARLENEDAQAGRDQAEANLRVAQSNLEEAKAALEEATKNYHRSQELVARELIARAEFDVAESRYKRSLATVAAAEAGIGAASASLRGAEVALEYSLIRAPFDAVVLTKNADIGDIVTPLGAAANAKAAVVTIADMGSLQVEADVSETHLIEIKVGQPCEIQLDAIPGSRFRGTVHAIVPTADRTKATVMVKVRFLEKDPRILPEMRAKVLFLSRAIKREEQKARTVVNSKALVRGGNGDFVFLVEENKAVEKTVRTGEKLNEFMEILEGLKVGERAVLNPPKRLKSGSRIKIAEK